MNPVRSIYFPSPMVAIDPGTRESAYVVWSGQNVLQKGIEKNSDLMNILKYLGSTYPVFIEMIQSYGMSMGQETIDTCVWVGRFSSIGEAYLVFRRHIKLHHCGVPQAKDKNIRQALLDKYGPVSTKANPNPVHGGGHTNKMRSHLWAAFALATYVTERVKEGQELQIYKFPGEEEYDLEVKRIPEKDLLITPMEDFSRKF